MNIKRDTYAGFCIYCGAAGVTDEHWLSKWLGGDEFIRDGTCAPCQLKINDAIENPNSRGSFWSGRKAAGFQSHSKSKEPIPLTITLGGKDADILVPHDCNPGFLGMLALPEPSIHNQSVPAERTGGRTWDIVFTIFDPEKYEEFKAKYPHDAVRPRDLHIVPFMRLLAKIAHGFAVHVGIAFRPVLREFILEGNRALGEFYVGGVPGMGPKLDGGTFLTVRLIPINGKKYVEVTIQLFAQVGAPVYTVIVGEDAEGMETAQYAQEWGLSAELVDVVAQKPGYWAYAVAGDDTAYPEAKLIDIPDGFPHLTELRNIV